MSKIQVFIRDNDDEGTWEYIDEELLNLTEHDAEIRADAIEDFAELIESALLNAKFDITDVRPMAEQLKEQRE